MAVKKSHTKSIQSAVEFSVSIASNAQFTIYLFLFIYFRKFGIKMILHISRSDAIAFGGIQFSAFKIQTIFCILINFDAFRLFCLFSFANANAECSVLNVLTIYMIIDQSDWMHFHYKLMKSTNISGNWCMHSKLINSYGILWILPTEPFLNEIMFKY